MQPLYVFRLVGLLVNDSDYRSVLWVQWEKLQVPHLMTNTLCHAGWFQLT